MAGKDGQGERAMDDDGSFGRRPAGVAVITRLCA